jgi:hypothetical protein
MPNHLGLGNSDHVGYADDTCVWASGTDLETIRSKLEIRAANFARYAADCGLVMNASKTQLLIAGRGRLPQDFTVMVDGSKVSPATGLELLGVKFDTNLSTLPQAHNLATTARYRASTVARLAQHLPRGRYLRQLAGGLLMGKIGYAMPIIAQPRLTPSSASHLADLRAVQVCINNTARSITGLCRKDHIHVHDLLDRAGLPSLKALSVKATATAAWRAYHSDDGGGGQRNPLGLLLFGPQLGKCHTIDKDRMTRSKSDGLVDNPLRGEDTLVSHAASIWNSSRPLRETKTASAASKAAIILSRVVP